MTDKTAVPNEPWYAVLKFFAMVTGVAGSFTTSLFKDHVFYGFVGFFISSLLWFYVAWRQNERNMLLLQFTFIVSDIIGIVRWYK